MHEVLVNRLGGLSLHRKSVVRLTDRPDMTLDVYHGRTTTIQHQSLTLSCSIHYISVLSVHQSMVICHFTMSPSKLNLNVNELFDGSFQVSAADWIFPMKACPQQMTMVHLQCHLLQTRQKNLPRYLMLTVVQRSLAWTSQKNLSQYLRYLI